MCEQGILNAVNKVFPKSHQRFCLRHLYANFQNAGFRGKDLKKYMDNASYAYNQHKFDIAMDDLKKRVKRLGSGLVRYLKKPGLGMHLTQTARQIWLLTIRLRCLTSTSLMLGKNQLGQFVMV